MTAVKSQAVERGGIGAIFELLPVLTSGALQKH
jgi:hypothetical protein